MALGERRVLEPAPGIERRVASHPQASRWPLFSYGVVAISVGVFLFELLSFPELPYYGGLMRAAVADGQWWRVLTAIVVHGGALHLALNMSVVWTLGFTFERAIGTWRFALLSLIGALGSSSFALLLSPPNAITVGASGMILGWAGGMLPIASATGRKTIGTWLIQVALISLLPGVSWQGHLGGFLFGAGTGVLLRNRARAFAVGAPAVLAAAIAFTAWAIWGAQT